MRVASWATPPQFELREKAAPTLHPASKRHPQAPFPSPNGRHPTRITRVEAPACAFLIEHKNSRISHSSVRQSFMFSRISQVARHLSSAPVAVTAARTTRRFAFGSVMAPISADERNARTIQTAACLIIGDEVLGGKVDSPSVASTCAVLIQDV